MISAGKNTVSVIVPCFNAVKYTKQCVSSVLKHSTRDYELILINNGSSDTTKKYLDNLKKKTDIKNNLRKLTVIHLKQNKGVAYALNLGIRKSAGKYVCYINNDIIVTEKWLEKLIYAAGKNKKTAITGTLFNSFEDKKFIKLVEKDKSVIDKTANIISMKNKHKVKTARTIHGMCMFMKKSAFKKTGFFNEKFYPCFGEDIEFCERVKKAGFALADACDVFIFHYWNKSVRSKQFNKENKNIKTVMKKHYKKFSIPKTYKI